MTKIAARDGHSKRLYTAKIGLEFSMVPTSPTRAVTMHIPEAKVMSDA